MLHEHEYHAMFFCSSLIALIFNVLLTESTHVLINNNGNFGFLEICQVFLMYCLAYAFAWIFMVYTKFAFDAVEKYFRRGTCVLVMIVAYILYSVVYVGSVKYIIPMSEFMTSEKKEKYSAYAKDMYYGIKKPL